MEHTYEWRGQLEYTLKETCSEAQRFASACQVRSAAKTARIEVKGRAGQTGGWLVVLVKLQPEGFFGFWFLKYKDFSKCLKGQKAEDFPTLLAVLQQASPVSVIVHSLSQRLCFSRSQCVIYFHSSKTGGLVLKTPSNVLYTPLSSQARKPKGTGSYF